MKQIYSASNKLLNYKNNKGAERIKKLETKSADKICPLSFTEGTKIKRITLANHIDPRYWNLINEKGYYFCTHKDCSIIYFNNQINTYFTQDEVRTSVMHKQPYGTENRVACYCRNVTEAKIIEELITNQDCNTLNEIKKYTEANTGEYCIITNPMGKCCGAKIKEIIKLTLK